MPVGASALESRLELKFEANDSGVTRLVRRRAGGLCHIGKPYWDGTTLLTHLVNPTAGFFAGDRLEAEIELGPGASVLLSNPSATRLHTMGAGCSSATQVFRLGGGSFLEVHPELLIPQSNSEGTIHTRIEAAADASFFYLDLLAPGRTARGESLAWREVSMGLDIVIDGELQVRERARLAPALNGWRLATPDGRPGYVANLWLKLAGMDDPGSRLAALDEHEDLWWGASRLAPGLAVVRILSADSVRLKRACRLLRDELAKDQPALRARTGKL